MAACALLLMLSTAGAHASTLNVPSSFATIGAAYTAASNGDTILVADGTYSAAGDLGLTINKTLTIQSVNGAALTTIDCSSNYFAFVNSNSTIQGFTFKNSSSGDVSPIFVQVSCTISQCVFSHNTNFGGNGGAIELNGGTTTITGCTFDQNSGSGAISSSGGNATIDSCTFTNNNGQSGGGGGVINLNTGNVTITNSTFSNNTGGTQAGGVFYWRNGTLNVSDSSFTSNSASYGGVILEGAQGIVSPATFTRCTFTGNTASLKGGVAALEAGSSGTTSFIAVDCLFIGNSAVQDGGVVDGNTAGASANAVNLKNCSFYANDVTSGAATGVICGGATTTTTVTNCILYGDTAPKEISTANPSNSTTVTFTDIQQAAFAGGTGDINSDPLYVNAAGGDLHLSTGSPCIDTGTATGAPSTDYVSYAFGNTRSMGAYSPIIFVVTSATPIVAGNTTSTTVTATSADGSTTITNYTGTVHFTSTDGVATLPSDTTLVSGTGTFTPTLNTGGSQTITATDTVNAPFTGTSNAIAVPPTVTAVSVPANAAYRAGLVLSFTATFSENVTITGTDSTLGLIIGSTPRTAAFVSKTANSVTYSYTILAGETDTDGITVGALTLNTTTIQDAATNSANVSLTGVVPSTAGVIIDTTAPDTSITITPPNPSGSASASFNFSGNDGAGSGIASFECNLDGSPFTACTSPKTYTGLSNGFHTFKVRAIDSAGNVDPTPATFTWVIDTTPPDTAISSGPPNPSFDSSASFSFTGTDTSGSGVARFECDLDGGGFNTAASPITFSNLVDGSHTFQVRAIDDAGNIDPTPASYTWIVNVVPAFLSGPTATPNPAVVGVEVIFTAATLPADAEIKWDFGDGSPTAIGGTVSHTYTVVGTFTVQATARNIISSTTAATATFQIQVTDAQGVTALPGTILPLLVHGYWSFGNTDQVIVRASLPSTTFTSSANAIVNLSVNGVMRTFTFDSKGRYAPNVDRATLRLFVRTGGYFEFYANIKGNLAAGLATGVSLDANGHPKLAVVQISAGGKNYSAILPVKAAGRGKGTFGFKTKPK